MSALIVEEGLLYLNTLGIMSTSTRAQNRTFVSILGVVLPFAKLANYQFTSVIIDKHNFLLLNECKEGQ